MKHSSSHVGTKMSISLPKDLVIFLAEYQKKFEIKSRSEVVAKGLEKLREDYLAKAYKEHAEAWQNDPDNELWDKAAVDDGLSIEQISW